MNRKTVRPDDTSTVAWFDSHTHVFNPAFPMSANAGFLPEPFTVEDYRQRVRSLPVPPTGGVVVSASTQGFDQTYLLAALAELGPTWVGVTQVPASVSDDTLVALDAAGVRAVRFNLFRGGSAGIDELPRLAHRVHEVVGWHVELYVDSRNLAELTPVISKLPTVCVDHLGLSRAGLPSLVRLAGEGVRVKATGFGRLDFPAEVALRQLYQANPHALLLGTDLPCPRAPRPFHDSDYHLVREVLGEPAARLVTHDNAVDFYRTATTGALPDARRC